MTARIATLALRPVQPEAQERPREHWRCVLKTANTAKAREPLAALERLCGKACDERRNLAKAIATAK